MTVRDDVFYMGQALALAAKGRYSTMPNPTVGCVIVRDHQVIGQGYTQPPGQAHAEIQALQDCLARGQTTRNATTYVSLEPCCHYGRTGPCSQALIEAKIARVVFAIRDPNPLVSGQGAAQLRQAGIAITEGVLAEQAQALNRGFFKRMQQQRPWVRLKIAASLDGKIALANGQSQWLTGEAARADVQHWRALSGAILTGIGTVLADDPQLTIRELNAQPWQLPRQPLRVILDSQLRTPPNARLLGLPGKTLIIAANASRERQQRLQDAGAEVIILPNPQGQVDLAAVLETLAQREINDLWIEAGMQLNGSCLQSHVVDEVLLYQTPSILGNGGRDMVAMSIDTLAQRLHFHVIEQIKIGDDWRYRLKPQYLKETVEE